MFPITVTRVDVEGNDHVSDRDIEKAMALQVGDVLNGYFDLQPTSQAILDMGWFSEVVPELAQDGAVTFRVVETPAIKKLVIVGNTHVRDFDVFGLTLFSARIMPTWKIRQVLRENDIRVGKAFRKSDLQAALEAVVEEYRARGYILVMIGDVQLGETVTIEVIEGRVASNVVTGLSTVPMDFATGLIDLPTDEVLRQVDMTRVSKRLRESVYFSDVDIVPTAGPTSDSVVLNWTLTERVVLAAPAPLRSIALEGVEQFPMDVVLREVGWLPDGMVDNYGVLKAIEGVFNLYMRSGFVMVRFSDPRVDGDTLRLRVDEGMVSEIAFAAGTATNRRVLEKSLQVVVGRVLTRHDLQVTYQRLGSLGYFDDIVVDPQWAGTGVRVSVSVADKKTLGGLNGSLAFEPATGGIVGELSVTQRNLLGTGQDIALTYKRGVSTEGKPEASTWELGYSTLAPSTEFDLISFDLYRKTQDVTSDEEGDDVTETYLTLGGALRFNYPVGDYSDFVIGYRHDLERQLAETEWQLIDAVTVSLQEDSTDDFLFPMRGTRRSISLEKAGGFSAGKEYAKLDIVWTSFTPFYDSLFPGMDHVLAVRLKAGLGDDGLDGAQLYELGGPTTIRGIEGTRVQRMVIGNLEHRLELTEGFVLTAFADAGMNLDSVRWNEIKAAAGLELGISAAGVFVRLDVAWLLGEDGSWTPKFDIGFGPMF